MMRSPSTRVWRLGSIAVRGTSCLFVMAVITAGAAPSLAQDLSTYVPAEDGVLLATDVYQPLLGDSWPVILVRTPYDKTELREVWRAISLLGFAVVAQDTRGRFASEGLDTVFRHDADDGRTTVAWVRQQDWCNGSVGTFGGSAFAITQYLLAPDAGPALRSIMPVVATADVYADAFMQGGALREALVLNWLEGQGSLHMVDEIREHRQRDDWWEMVEVLPHSDRVTAAGLHVGGWYDIFAQGTLDAFTQLQSRGGVGAKERQYLIMGPWSHGSLGGRDVGELRYPSDAEVDPFDLVLPWYNHTLRGWSNEVEHWPPVQVYLMGAVGEDDAPGNRWLELTTWPPPTRLRSLYLSETGTLSWGVPAPGELELLIDPADPVPTLGGANLFPDLVVHGRPMGDGPVDQRPIEQRADVLTFTTDPLTRPVTVMGRVSATLWLRPDTRDLDLAVRLTDVYPDGRSMLVLDGVQRARMRCGDDRECLLVPGQPTRITVDLWSTAITFNAGHRIRVSVSGSNAPRFELNPNHGGDIDGDDPAVVARPALLLGPDSPSRLELPIAPGDPVRSGARRVPAAGIDLLLAPIGRLFR